LQGLSCGRPDLRARTAAAFAPAAITNFFSVRYKPQADGDFRNVGATGGGYVLSKGVTTRATLRETLGDNRIEVIVDGDPKYLAGTTRKAVELLFSGHGRPRGRLILEQSMGIPVGCGFGASAAAAISAVYAVAAAMRLKLAKRELAYYAHVADIVEQTGLGTVSVTYDGTGAGAITRAGAPGISRFLNVEYPSGTKIVTAWLAPFKKSDAIARPGTVKRINRLGNKALRNLVATPTLETLASEGERFSEGLGLMTSEVRDLAKLAKASGASYASQNMIGYAVHALTTAARAEAVAAALRDSSAKPLVEVFEIGSRRAGVLKPRVTASRRSAVPS
jgi:pantoate kinase